MMHRWMDGYIFKKDFKYIFHFFLVDVKMDSIL